MVVHLLQVARIWSSMNACTAWMIELSGAAVMTGCKAEGGMLLASMSFKAEAASKEDVVGVVIVVGPNRPAIAKVESC